MICCGYCICSYFLIFQGPISEIARFVIEEREVKNDNNHSFLIIINNLFFFPSTRVPPFQVNQAKMFLGLKLFKGFSLFPLSFLLSLTIFQNHKKNRGSPIELLPYEVSLPILFLTFILFFSLPFSRGSNKWSFHQKHTRFSQVL